MKKQQKLLFIIIPVILVFFLIVFFTQGFFANMIKKETEKSWQELSNSRTHLAEDVSLTFKTNMQILDLLSDVLIYDVDINNENEVNDYLNNLYEMTIFNRIDIIYANGNILTQDGQTIKNEVYNYNELVEECTKNNGHYISKRSLDYLYTDKTSIHVFLLIQDKDNNTLAILSATSYCTSLEEVFYNDNYGEKAQLFLIDMRDGNFILDSWNEQLENIYIMDDHKLADGFEDIDFVSEIMSGNTNNVAFVSQTKGDILYMSYCAVEGTPYSLAIIAQDDVVFDQVNQLNESLLVSGIIEIVILVLLGVSIFFIIKRALENKNRAQEAEIALLHSKEIELKNKINEQIAKHEFTETLAKNLPGGYHRCSTDHEFRVTFVSDSFTKVTGYTLEQLNEEYNGSYRGIIAPEDYEYFMSLAPELEQNKYIECAYRIRRRDGIIRWVQDATQYINKDGDEYYQCVLSDITEIIETIEKTKLKAEASSQAKSKFLFNISHDIRTPMNAIKGYSEIISNNYNDPQLVKNNINKILYSSNTLMSLMNDVLELSRIEQHKEEINLEKIQINNLKKELIEMFEVEMQDAGIEFVIDANIQHTNIVSDKLKLIRICMNMLSNAKKFTPKGGVVTLGIHELSANEKEATYYFFVKDTGIGMSKDFLEIAFNQFERERSSTESKIAGSGLGLAIIKEYAELLGGKVELTSELGKGTKISVIITVDLVTNMQIENNQESELIFDISGKRILLVEDNDFNREIAKYVLESLNLVVEEVENGALCLEKLLSKESDYYDLILMDIQMPVMDGYTTTINIRNIKNTILSNIPIIAMTANAFAEDKQKCLEVGMNGHIAKPLDNNELKKTIEKVLNSER